MTSTWHQSVSWELLWHTLQHSLNISITRLEKIRLMDRIPAWFAVVNGSTIAIKSHVCSHFWMSEIPSHNTSVISMCLCLPAHLLDSCFPLHTILNSLTPGFLECLIIYVLKSICIATNEISDILSIPPCFTGHTPVLTTSCRSGFAPAPSRSPTTLWWPLKLACSSAVHPFCMNKCMEEIKRKKRPMNGRQKITR